MEPYDKNGNLTCALCNQALTQDEIDSQPTYEDALALCHSCNAHGLSGSGWPACDALYADRVQRRRKLGD